MSFSKVIVLSLSGAEARALRKIVADFLKNDGGVTSDGFMRQMEAIAENWPNWLSTYNMSFIDNDSVGFDGLYIVEEFLAKIPGVTCHHVATGHIFVSLVHPGLKMKIGDLNKLARRKAIYSQRTVRRLWQAVTEGIRSAGSETPCVAIIEIMLGPTRLEDSDFEMISKKEPGTLLGTEIDAPIMKGAGTSRTRF